MKVISLISQKGGAGKTTLALHFAVAFFRAGSNVAVLDLDPQASASNWSDRREDEMPLVFSVHATRLKQEMKRMSDAGCEIVLLDTAPHSDSTALAAAEKSDLVIVPCRPTILDIEAVMTTLSLVAYKGTKTCVVLNGVASQGADAAKAAAAIEQNQGKYATVSAYSLANRINYSRALVAGLTAQEYQPTSKAAAEFAELFNAICEAAGIAQTSGENHD